MKYLYFATANRYLGLLRLKQVSKVDIMKGNRLAIVMKFKNNFF